MSNMNLSINFRDCFDEFDFGSTCLFVTIQYILLRTVSNAVSMLEVSRADVSINPMPFSAI